MNKKSSYKNENLANFKIKNFLLKSTAILLYHSIMYSS